MAASSKIIYTLTDEAPALATRSLLPIVQAFTGAAGVDVETRDISLAARILAAFPEWLTDEQRVPDSLAELGALTHEPDANIIKLPNISASIPQIKAAVRELQAQGYGVPDYPEDVESDEDRDIRARFDKVKGSAVNPVLREGNSDRRAPAAVKAYARKNPHSMGAWSADSKTHVATMSDRRLPLDRDVGHRRRRRRRSHRARRRRRLGHRPEGVDSVARRRDHRRRGHAAPRRWSTSSPRRSPTPQATGVLFSVHLKATMMKVSDPIIFGHVVRTYFADLFAANADTFDDAGISPNDGLASLESAVGDLPADVQATVQAQIAMAYERGPSLAMVDSDRGITNLHVPSDVIIDASMPAMIRTSGQMWNADGNQQDTKCVIPDSSYASLYDETIEFCKEHGAFDPTTMGTTPNVGLMAQKAEEYGSHDKTFEIDEPGTVRVVDRSGATLLSHEVDTGDIWRMCQTKDAPIRDWVKLAVTRARATGAPAVFWLDETRAHDAQLIAKVREELGNRDTDGLTIEIMDVASATRYTLARAKAGDDTISVTGNVLRDYLTDLFPILELGTSAKMLSIVPLMRGGGLFETGAGGSAPKHVQQFEKENHLRWDSLGEFLALAVSLEHLAQHSGNARAQLLAETLDAATEKLLDTNKSPSRKVNELDNRGSHFYLALYWAEALANQTTDAEMAERFGPLAAALAADEAVIVGELIEVQGQPMDVGGYYFPDPERADAAMRPSHTLRQILESFER